MPNNNYKIIVATDLNGLIGNKGKIPWHIKEDLQYFRKITLGHQVIMGRKTFESLEKPLNQRTNIVLTKQTHIKNKEVKVCSDWKSVPFPEKNELQFIIGGSEIYKQGLEKSDTIYRTLIKAKFIGDTYFPQIDWQSWQLTSSETLLTSLGWEVEFQTWQKK